MKKNGVRTKFARFCLLTVLAISSCYEASGTKEGEKCTEGSRCKDNTVQDCVEGVWNDRIACDGTGMVCRERMSGAQCEDSNTTLIHTTEHNNNQSGTDPTDINVVTDTPPTIHADTSQCVADHQPKHAEDWIANFETGTLQAGNSYEDYVGFFAYNDETEGAKMLPEPLEDGVGPATMNMEACSNGVMCFKNTVGTFDLWGAGVGMMLGLDDEGTPRTMDLTPYRGLALYAIRLSGVSAVSVKFPDTNTHPAGDVCELDGDTTGCYNDWSTNILMTEESEWTRYEILFENLEVNPDWGLQPHEFLQDQVYGIQFQVGEQADFNFCIDDIYLFR